MTFAGAPLTAFVVGLGRIGLAYDSDAPADSEVVLTHCRAFHVHPRFKLVGATDVDDRRRAQFTRTYGAPAYGDLDRGLLETMPDVVVIATPTGTHLDVLRHVLETWAPQYILAEKPLASSVDQAVEMDNRCRAARTELLVNYMRRSDPAVERIRQMIDGAVYESPFVGRLLYSNGVVNSASHFVNLFELWFGRILRVESHHHVWAPQVSDPNLDFDVHFDGGVIHFLASPPSEYASTGFEVTFRNGQLRTFNGANDFEWQKPEPDPYYPSRRVLGQHGTTLKSEAGRSQWHVVDQIAKRSEGAPARLCGAVDAISTIRSVRSIL